ncbi:MAG: iron-containing alcohol dehydrogenase [Planctomycetia bacterium]|nr:iron-containing alcohol dehydrogenase [Planctomycetia bacterium]
MSAIFRSPPIIHYGAGALEQLGPTARELGLRQVLLVTDPGMVQLGVADKARSQLEAAAVCVVVFDGVQPDPTLANVEAGLTVLRQQGCDGLVAIGGGSPIDCAKAIAVRHTHPEPLPEFAGVEKFPRPGLPLIAVPTTAGTGSEVTRVMVITDTDRDVKMMFASRSCLAAAAIVDPVLTLGMPKGLTAAVGVDALTHALEAYVSRRAQPQTDLLALSAIRLIAHNLRTAYHDGSNLEARSAVMLGAMQAGLAFSNASVALVHGMARPLGACFHLTHGLSIAVLLPAVTEFSQSSAPERYARAAFEMGQQDIVGALRHLNRDVGIPKLRNLNVPAERFESLLDKMAADALASGSPANNPRQASAEEIVALYRRVYAETA